MWTPLTALQASKRNSTSPHTRDSTATGTAAIAVVILRRKPGRNSTLSLCAMSLSYTQNKTSTPWEPIKESSPVGPLIRKSSVQSRACKGSKMGWCIILLENEAVIISCLWEHKVLLTCPVILHTWRCSHGRSRSSNSVRGDIVTSRRPWGCKKHAPLGHGLLTAQNPAIMVVYNTVCEWKVASSERTLLNDSRFHPVPACRSAACPSL
jgi:hypothetical protein